MVRMIGEADFDAVKRCVDYKDNVSFDDLEKELVALFFDESLRPKLSPTPAKQRDLVNELLSNSNKQIDQIENLYGFPYENSFGAEMLYLDIPPHLNSIVENIEANQLALEILREQFPTNLKSGRRLETRFSDLVSKLATVFIEYTGLPVKTNPDMDANKPPAFQDFAEKCFMALRYKVPDGFETKLHRNILKLRAQGKIPKR
jgi:hypothetical protein